MTYTGITYDSRKVKTGDVFVAIPGAKYDGTQFIPQAIASGAKLIVAEKDISVSQGVKFKKVVSARRALAEMACDFYDNPSKKLKLIGVTGTKGKTTTAYFIRSVLETAGYKVGIIGTIDNAMTTPESSDLQRMLAEMVEQGVTHCVMEVSSHALAQERVAGCHFAVAIFTNLSHDHLDFHKTTEDYLSAKKKLFEMLPPDGIAIVNVDDPASKDIIEVVKGEIISYGITQARHELRSTKHNEFDTTVDDILIREKDMRLKVNSFEIHTPLIGLANVYNIAAAFQCGMVFHIPQATIKKGIEKLKSIPGRFERVECGQPFTVIVDFAHSPDSLQKLLETYRPLTKGKLILVFGCPGDRDKAKRPIMGKIAADLADYTIITTDDPHGEDPGKIAEEVSAGIRESGDRGIGDRYSAIIDRKTAIEKALRMAKEGDTVLIAGRGHEKFQDFAGKKIAIDDREAVREIYKSLN